MAGLAELEAIYQYLKYERLIVDYFYITGAAVLIYDYLLTLHNEITLIWFSPWNYTKVLFLLVRYLPMVCIYLELHNQLLMDLTLESCRWTLPCLIWMLTAAISSADVVLTIRTWAVWRRDRRIGFVLTLMLTGSIVASCVFNVRFIKSMILTPAPYPGFRGCFITKINRIMVVDWITLTVLDTSVLALMVVNAFQAHKRGDRNRLSNVIHRDGIVSYVYLLAIIIANLICMVALPHEFEVVLAPLLVALYSSLTCRIILNIRDLGRRGTGGMVTELHTGYEETDPVVIPLGFLSRGSRYGISMSVSNMTAS